MCLVGYCALTTQGCFNGSEFSKEHTMLIILQLTEKCSEQVLQLEALSWF